jgi:hypothetical protein
MANESIPSVTLFFTDILYLLVHVPRGTCTNFEDYHGTSYKPTYDTETDPLGLLLQPWHFWKISACTLQIGSQIWWAWPGFCVGNFFLKVKRIY